MRTVEQGSPTATGALESEPFHKGESHGFDGMPGDGTGILFDGLTVAIVTVVGISEMEHVAIHQCHQGLRVLALWDERVYSMNVRQVSTGFYSRDVPTMYVFREVIVSRHTCGSWIQRLPLSP